MNITKKWFDGEPKNAIKASIDATDNSGLTILANIAGEAYNGWEVNLIDPKGNDEDLDIAIGNKKIDISLATGNDGAITTTFKELGEVLEGSIITVEYAENNALTKVKEEKELKLDDGEYGTVCQDIYVTVEHDSDYYVNILPNSIHDANWRKVTLATY